MSASLSRLLAAAALLGVACGSPGAATESSTTAHAPHAEAAKGTPVGAGFVARYGRGACYGACPIYEVTIKDDGAVLYEGRTFVVTEGRAEKKISREDVDRVRAAFDGASFFTAEAPVTSSSNSGPSEDFIFYARDGKERRIDLPTGCDGTPVGKALTDLTIELDRIVAIEKWIGTPKERERFGSGFAK